MELHLTSLRAFPLSQVSTLSRLENCLLGILSFIVPPAAQPVLRQRLDVCMTNLILEVIGGKEGGIYTSNLSPIFSFLLGDVNMGQGVLQTTRLYLTG